MMLMVRLANADDEERASYDTYLPMITYGHKYGGGIRQ